MSKDTRHIALRTRSLTFFSFQLMPTTAKASVIFESKEIKYKKVKKRAKNNDIIKIDLKKYCFKK